MSAPVDFLPVITAVDGRTLAKILTRDKSGKLRVGTDAQFPYKCRVEERPVSNITDVYENLSAVAPNKHKCVLRGGIKPGFEEQATTDWVRRLVYERPSEHRGEVVFEERARWWAAFDLDSFALPDHIDPLTDIELIIDAGLSVLPRAFHDASFCWQVTGSHGIKSGGRIRLWFWLSRAMTNAEMIAWMQGVKVDCSIYQIQQPHFTANPVFPKGMADFLPVRNGFRAGDVDFVEAPLAGSLNVQTNNGVRYKAPGDINPVVASTVAEALDQMGDPPDYPGGHGFRFPVQRAIQIAVRQFGSGVDRASLLVLIEEKIRERCKRGAGYTNSRIRDAGNLLKWFIARQAEREAGPKPCDPPFIAPGLTADEAAAALVDPVRTFMQSAARGADKRLTAMLHQHDTMTTTILQRTPPQGDEAMVLAGLGLGKTHVTLDEAADIIRAAPTDRALPFRVGAVVPDHDLASDVARRFAANHPDVPVHVHLGMDQPDPRNPEFKMCRRPDDAKAITDATGEMAAICGSKKRGFCPFHPKSDTVAAGGPACGYQLAQKPKGGLVLLAGPDAPTRGVPGALRRSKSVNRTIWVAGEQKIEQHSIQLDPFDIVIADEAQPLSWLGGVGGDPYDADPDSLTSALAPYGRGIGNSTEQGKADNVAAAFTGLRDIFRGLPAGNLTHTAVKQIAALADWKNVRKDAFYFLAGFIDHIDPRWTGKELFNAVRELNKHNARIYRRGRVAKVIRQAATDLEGQPDDALSGLMVAVHDGDKRVLRLRWREDIQRQWRGIPTLLLDATGDPEIARKWFPTLTVIADAKAATPAAVTRQQVHDSAFAYTSWVPKEPQRPASDAPHTAEKTRWNNAELLLRHLTVRCAEYQGQGTGGYDWLAIVPQGLEEALLKLWEGLAGKPERLAIAHWKKIRGLDLYGGVRGCTLVSRPLPPTATVERMAQALTGVVGQTIPDGMLPEAQGAYLMRDGAGRAATTPQHPDPWVQRVIRQLVHSEVLQGEGRPRPVRRTPDRPLLTEIWTNIPLQVEIDELITKEKALERATVPHWLVASGVAPKLTGRGHREFLATVLGIDEEAVKKRLQREPEWQQVLGGFQPGSLGTNPIRNTLMGNVPSESWNLFGVKTSRETRYSLPVWTTAHDEPGARARLLAVGIEPAEVRLAPKAGPKAAQPAATPLPPVMVGVNATITMPTLNASVEVLAIPEPANEPVEVLPWNGLTPAQQAAVAELVEQWRGDDLFMVFDKPLPPLPRKQHIAVQPVRAEAMRPSFAAPANADPVAPCFEGVCGEGLDPSAVFARGGDMAVCDGSWWLSGSGIRKVEEWRAAPLPASPEAQASAL